MSAPAPVVVVCGVSGSGKTTVGRALAQRMALRFLDADDLHSPAAIDKMSRGRPLDDADRTPWLRRVAAEMAAARLGGLGLVVACSALKVRYRDILRRSDTHPLFLLLEAPRALLEQRLEGRTGHFMPRDLLDSQLDALEAALPTETDVRTVLASAQIEIIVDQMSS